MKEYAFINAFRALAAFWVLSAHVLIWGGGFNPTPAPKLAVDLFMLVSGFLMAANARSREHFEPLSETRNWLRFWLRRFFRIAPAYYLALAAAFFTQDYFAAGYRALQDRPFGFDFSAESLLLHVTFLFGLHPDYASSTGLPDWSLSLEMQFYFIFPALLVYMARGFVRQAFFIGLNAAAIGLALFLAGRYGLMPKFPDPAFLFFKLQYFIAGMLVFWSLANPSKWAVAVAVVLVSLEAHIYRAQFVVLPLLVLAMVWLGRKEARGALPRWINSRLVRFASDTSYGVYLFHGFALSAFGLIAGGYDFSPLQRVALLLPFAVFFSYLAGWVCFRLIETPGIAIGKRVIGLVRPRRATYDAAR